MARARMLSASISNSRKLASLSSDGARLLFTWMIPHADNLGRLRGEPVQVKGQVLPRHQCTDRQVDRWLGELSKAGLIRWYIHQDQRFIAIEGWKNHQRLHHTSSQNSNLPDPDAPDSTAYGDLTVRPRLANGEATPDPRSEVEVELEGELELEPSTRVDDVRVLCEWLEAFNEYFWPEYPRKVAREEAEGAWRKLYRPGKTLEDHEELLTQVLTGLRWYRENEWADRELKHVTYAATWLNGGRWKDHEAKTASRSTG